MPWPGPRSVEQRLVPPPIVEHVPVAPDMAVHLALPSWGLDTLHQPATPDIAVHLLLAVSDAASRLHH